VRRSRLTFALPPLVLLLTTVTVGSATGGAAPGSENAAGLRSQAPNELKQKKLDSRLAAIARASRVHGAAAAREQATSQ
jgi:hypothetical protein